MCSIMRRPGPWARGLGILAAALAVNLAAEEVSVQVYECHQGDKVTFSDSPCSGQEQTITLDYGRPNAAEAAQATQTAVVQGERAWNAAQANLLDAQILNMAQQISNLETERDARIAALRAELTRGTESTDSDAWAAGLNKEIVSAAKGYNDNILAQRQRLDQLKAQRAALGSALPLPPPGAPAP